MEVVIKRKEVKYKQQNESDLKLRVVAYARVSTEHERQLGSFESQKSYYYEKITSNPDWTFAGIYADEGISGTSSEQRPGFVNMIRAAKDRNFDLILTKSISRFARNTVDTLKFIRFLKERGIGIYFEEENINTNAIQGELLITILSSLAQQESENVSSHIVRGIEMSLQNGTRKVWNTCYGYDYESGSNKLTINKKAEIVKLIFELYCKYKNLNKVKEELFNRGIESPTGKKIWSSRTISGLLTNEKYIGNAVFGGYYVADSLKHRLKINYGERNKYRYINHHEAIIDKELFDKANKIFEINRRKRTRPQKVDKYDLGAWKGMCGFCGCSLGKKNNTKRSMQSYQCRNSLFRITRPLCTHSSHIKGREIESSFLRAMKKLRNKINLNTLDNKTEQRIAYVRSIIMNEKFDRFKFELYDKIVNIIIVGGYRNDGTPDPYQIRFILKEDILFDNRYKNRRRFCNKTVEVLSFENILNIYYGSYDENRNYSRTYIDSINVKVEFQDDESLIWK